MLYPCPTNWTVIAAVWRTRPSASAWALWFVANWSRVGTIIQATPIDDYPNVDASRLPADTYLEVHSQLEDGPPVLPWPTNADDD